MAIDDWNRYPETRPIKGGKYLVVVTTETTNPAYLVTLSDYDPFIHQFDFDQIMRKRGSESHVYAWLRYKEPPIPPLKTPKKRGTKNDY